MVCGSAYEMKFTIQCEECKTWVHYLCTGLPLYQLLCLAHTHRRFTCEKCCFEKFGDPNWTAEASEATLAAQACNDSTTKDYDNISADPQPAKLTAEKEQSSSPDEDPNSSGLGANQLAQEGISQGICDKKALKNLVNQA